MNAAAARLGPDIAIVGSARSGSTFLASLLAEHPLIDAPAVKEPDYFSFNFSRGPEWYDSMFPPRRPSHLRMDASVSYTYTEAMGALDRLAAVSPHVRILYLVREPLERMVSHFLHYRDYAGVDSNEHLGPALERGYDYAGASDYACWLPALNARFPVEHILVVPFPVLVAESQQLLNTVLEWLMLSAVSAPSTAYMFRNSSVQPRNALIGSVLHRVLASRIYPGLRKALGATKIRRIRTLVTRQNTSDVALELGTLNAAQRAYMDQLRRRSVEAVYEWLVSQDRVLATEWSSVWRHAHLGNR